MAHSGARVLGLISDTHGLLRPRVYEALSGVELILHAGDVGGQDILTELRLIAPVKAVFGNTDPPGDPELVREILVEIGGARVHVSHGHEVGSPTPASSGGTLRCGCRRLRPHASPAGDGARWQAVRKSGSGRPEAVQS